MRTKIDVEVIENVRELRKKRDVSRKNILAEAINTSTGFAGQVETKSHWAKYSVTRVYMIAKFFECEVSDIYPPIDRLEA